MPKNPAGLRNVGRLWLNFGKTWWCNFLMMMMMMMMMIFFTAVFSFSLCLSLSLSLPSILLCRNSRGVHPKPWNADVQETTIGAVARQCGVGWLLRHEQLEDMGHHHSIHSCVQCCSFRSLHSLSGVKSLPGRKQKSRRMGLWAFSHTNQAAPFSIHGITESRTFGNLQVPMLHSFVLSEEWQSTWRQVDRQWTEHRQPGCVANASSDRILSKTMWWSITPRGRDQLVVLLFCTNTYDGVYSLIICSNLRVYYTYIYIIIYKHPIDHR